MELVTRPATAFQIEDSEPLYKRAPARDAAGRPVGDFMVLIPGLRERSRQEFAEVVARLQAVLAGFREVVFVDLNVPLNLLWVSVEPRPGVILELFGALQQQLPEARLVGHRSE